MIIDYRPPKSLLPLFSSDKFWNLIIGPVGSAKTTACIFWLLMKAAQQTPSARGIRRTRYVISRTTLSQLKMTVLRDIQSWLGPIISWRSSESLIVIEQGNIHSEWFLLPLETVQDQRRLLSLQLSGAWFNEAREIPMELITAAAGRIPRFPSRGEEGVAHPFILMDSNPGVVGSELYEMAMRAGTEQGKDILYIHQPSGLSPEADWRQWLDPNYYERLIEGASKAWVDVHVHGKWGRDVSNTAVHGANFDDEVHTAVDLQCDGPTILIGVDPGRQPAALIAGVDKSGQVKVLQEIYRENTDFKTFIEYDLRPALAPYLGKLILFIMDPAGRNRGTTTNDSPYSMLKSAGYNVTLAATNDIEPRLAAVDRLLVGRNSRQEPLIVFDRLRCPVTIRGLRYEYRFSRREGGVWDNRPKKTHPVSDLMDCLQYIALSVLGKTADRLRDNLIAQRNKGASYVDLSGWA